MMAEEEKGGALDAESQALEERLKSALWYSIGKIVDEETLRLGVNATPQFIGSLTELTWAQIGNTANDLESFAQHAGRSTITTADVMLLTRRNDGLAAILGEFVRGLEGKNREGKRGKKTAGEKARGKGKD